MESSFLEDILKRKVDENAVSAIVGSLQSQLSSAGTTGTSSIGSVRPSFSSSPNLTASVVSQGGSRDASQRIELKSNPVIRSQPNGNVGSPSIVNYATPNMSSPSNIRPNVVLTRVVTPLRTSMPTSSPQQPQISIAPKTTLSGAIPIAPRIPTTIMITPQQAQMLMSQRFSGGATLIPRNILNQMSTAQVPLAPRLGVTTNGPVGPMSMIPGQQIPVMQNIAPRVNPQHNNQINLTTSQNKSNLDRVKLEEHTVKMSGGPNLSVSNNIASRPSIPGAVTYRFRPSNPIVSGIQSGSVINGQQQQQQNIMNLNVTKESVKKLKEFFQNLINLASGPNQPHEIGRAVKELVQNVMHGKITEELFVDKLQVTLKSDPQPNLIPFLKKTLPHLRESVNQSQKMQQYQLLQSKGQVTDGNGRLLTQQVQNTNHDGSIKNQPLLLPTQQTVDGQNITQIVIPKGLTTEQQNLIHRQLAQVPNRRFVLTTMQSATIPKQQYPVATLAMPTTKTGTSKIATPLQLSAAAAGADKSKPRSFHYSSALTSGDDDINDVTCMAGVNLMEESARILASGSDLLGSQTRSCQDETFLNMDLLKRRVEAIARKKNVGDISQSALALISHAVQERLKNIIERLTVCSVHRVEPPQGQEFISDIRNQLKVFEQIDEVERKHREAKEREILMRVAKSRSRTEDPEQARLKEKAKQLQQEEDDQLRKRAANKTALEAIGGPRKKRFLDKALENLQSDQGSPSSSSMTQPPSQSSMAGRIRARRIIAKDLHLVLEQEKETSKSLLLYRTFLR